MFVLPSRERMQTIFAETKNIAVVGLSPKPQRASYQVASYLMGVGYTIIPVNPGQKEILGMQCYPDLRAVEQPIDVVDIFRRADQIEPIVRDAIAVGARVIWMQQGIVNEQAAALAEAAGITVIMDRCMKVDHLQLMGK